MIKQINLVFTAACLSLFACSQKNPNGNFEVSGTIKGVNKQLVYLQQFPFEGAALQVVDSATLNKDGSYDLKSINKEEALYVVGVENGPQAIFVNDNDDITINFDSSNFRHPEIKNSDATKSLYSFMDDYIKRDSLAGVAYQKAQQEPENDSLRQAFEQQLTGLTNYIKDYINKAPSPALVYFAISQIPPGMMAPDDMLTLVNSASKRFPGHTGLNLLKQRLTEMAGNGSDSTGNKTYALMGKQAPDLTMQDVNGKKVSISDFKGKYLLVDFWASWCGPCRQENPNVVAAYNQFKNKNFTILGVSLDEDKDAWKQAIQKDGLAWNQMSDLKQWESEAVNAYGFDGIPFNVLIDPGGKIIASSLRGPELQAKLAEVLP